MKTCNKCNVNKPDNEYSMQRGRLRTTCKECRRIESKEWYSQNIEKKRELSRAYRHIKKDQDLRKQYGISLEQYNQMLEEQKGACKICSVPSEQLSRALCVDHCHATGKIRGLLCDTCNRSLGLLKDNVSVLRAAVKYLEDHIE